jgi:N-acylneuraminate cytidylyltransferase
MRTTKNILAIIPARKGSKRLPGKNMMQLLGKPLVQWSIEAALNCDDIDTVLVSTDDKDLAALSLQLGAEAPFLRPNNLATDESKTIDVVTHAVDYYQQIGIEYKYILVLQPTSPLRTSVHIQEAIDLLYKSNANGVISVCPCEHTPLWSNVLPADNNMEHFLKEDLKNKRSQDLPIFHRLNGAIYLIKTTQITLESSLFPSRNTTAYIMPAIESVDIDHELDFLLAETILNKKNDRKAN